MLTRPLGRHTGVEVSEVGMGLWAVAGSEWGPADDEPTLQAIEAALEAGVDFFDTADVYGEGHSEELLGRAMAGRRHRFVVATKIGWIGYDRQSDRSAYDSPDKIVDGVHASLRRLGTDHLDVIQCHIDHLEPHTDVFVEGFRRLATDGTVRAWGVSTSEIELLRRFNADGGCGLLQTDYSILNRTAESELLPYCRQHGIGVIVRGPLAMGLLTGKYSAGDRFPVGDFRREWTDDPDQRSRYLRDLDVVESLRPLVPEGETMAQFALRFVRSHPAVSTVIPGARNPRQATSNAEAGNRPPLSDAEREAVDRLVPPGGGRKTWPA